MSTQNLQRTLPTQSLTGVSRQKLYTLQLNAEVWVLRGAIGGKGYEKGCKACDKGCKRGAIGGKEVR